MLRSFDILLDFRKYLNSNSSFCFVPLFFENPKNFFVDNIFFPQLINKFAYDN